jgi:membrane dipeptidase
MIDAIKASSQPIVCSHAGLRSVSPKNKRTHPDDALKKFADSGSVLGLVGSPRVLAADVPDKPDVKMFVASIDRAVENVGVGHWPWPDLFIGMGNHFGYPNLTRGLIALGYKDEDIAKIMGGNFLRIVEEVIG